MYSPEEKQFLTTDKAHQHTTPYAFAMNDPVNRVDLDGNVALFLSNLELNDATAANFEAYSHGMNAVHMDYEDFIEYGLPSGVSASDINHVVFSSHGDVTGNAFHTAAEVGRGRSQGAAFTGEEMGDAFNSLGIEPDRVTLLCCESGGTTLDNFVGGLQKSEFKGATEVQGFHGKVKATGDYVNLSGDTEKGRMTRAEHIDDEGTLSETFNMYDKQNNLLIMSSGENENYQSFGRTGDFEGAETSPHIRRVQVNTSEVSREAESEVESLGGAVGGFHIE